MFPLALPSLPPANGHVIKPALCLFFQLAEDSLTFLFCYGSCFSLSDTWDAFILPRKSEFTAWARADLSKKKIMMDAELALLANLCVRVKV